MQGCDSGVKREAPKSFQKHGKSSHSQPPCPEKGCGVTNCGYCGGNEIKRGKNNQGTPVHSAAERGLTF